MSNSNWLVVVPVLMALALIIGMTTIARKPQASSQSSVTNLMQHERTEATDGELIVTPVVPLSVVPTSESDCTSCMSMITEAKCTDNSTPVLGGVDVVNYFTAYKNADGTYDESKVGVAGSKDFSASYMGYNFYFVSEENKKLFESAPDKYAPQYGGFCTWGMSTEFCPTSPWSTDCLGPYGNWAHWTIQNDKLYFFWFGDAKGKFAVSDMNSLIATADKRWSEWYGNDMEKVFSTNCYSSVALPDDSSIKNSKGK